MPYSDLDKRRQYKRDYYLANKDKALARARVSQKQHKQRIRQWLWDYKLSHPCVDCGETDPIVLDFDHIKDTKAFNIADFSSRYIALERVQAEVDKCEVRCANCHRRVTYHRRNGSLAQ